MVGPGQVETGAESEGREGDGMRWGGAEGLPVATRESHMMVRVERPCMANTNDGIRIG